MARKGFLNGKLYTYTAEEEAAQDAEESKTLAEDAAIKYVNERQVGTATNVGYVTVEEQLDKLYHDINAGKLDATGSFAVHNKAVKDANPKPS